jgi:hypothetical protein
MLGTLRMSLDDAIDGLLTLADSLFPQGDTEISRTPDKNLDSIRSVIGDLLSRHDLPEDVKLSDPRVRSSKSKV